MSTGLLKKTLVRGTFPLLGVSGHGTLRAAGGGGGAGRRMGEGSWKEAVMGW